MTTTILGCFNIFQKMMQIVAVCSSASTAVTAKRIWVSLFTKFGQSFVKIFMTLFCISIGDMSRHMVEHPNESRICCIRDSNDIIQKNVSCQSFENNKVSLFTKKNHSLFYIFLRMFCQHRSCWRALKKLTWIMM